MNYTALNLWTVHLALLALVNTYAQAELFKVSGPTSPDEVAESSIIEISFDEHPGKVIFSKTGELIMTTGNPDIRFVTGTIKTFDYNHPDAPQALPKGIGNDCQSVSDICAGFINCDKELFKKDWHCDIWDTQSSNSNQIWIESQSKARITVKVRQALVNSAPDNQAIAREYEPRTTPQHWDTDKNTYFGEWAEQTYTIYPDGTITRYAVVYTNHADKSDLSAHGCPCIDTKSKMMHHFFSGAFDIPSNKRGSIIAGGKDSPFEQPKFDTKDIEKTILLHQIDNDPKQAKPWIMVRDRDNPALDTKNHSIKLINQKPYERVIYPKAPGSRFISQVYLHGLSLQPSMLESSLELKHIAKSWDNPPFMIIKGKAFVKKFGPRSEFDNYVHHERAYHIKRVRENFDFHFTLVPDTTRSLYNPVVVVDNWGKELPPAILVNEKELEQGQDYQMGLEGDRLVVWFNMTPMKKTVFQIKRTKSDPIEKNKTQIKTDTKDPMLIGVHNLGKVLCLGDSYSTCNGEHNTWRYFLWKQWVDSDTTADFIGTMGDSDCDTPDHAGQSFDDDHEAHSGATIRGLLQMLPTWLEMPNYTPDIVFMMLGGNDFDATPEQPPLQEMVDDIERMIDLLRADNPKVKVYLGSYLRFNEATLDVRYLNLAFTEFYKMQQRMALKKTTEQSPIIFVDHFGNSNDFTDLQQDGFHPNKKGMKLIAENWKKVVNP